MKVYQHVHFRFRYFYALLGYTLQKDIVITQRKDESTALPNNADCRSKKEKDLDKDVLRITSVARTGFTQTVCPFHATTYSIQYGDNVLECWA